MRFMYVKAFDVVLLFSYLKEISCVYCTYKETTAHGSKSLSGNCLEYCCENVGIVSDPQLCCYSSNTVFFLAIVICLCVVAPIFICYRVFSKRRSQQGAVFSVPALYQANQVPLLNPNTNSSTPAYTQVAFALAVPLSIQNNNTNQAAVAQGDQLPHYNSVAKHT